MVNGVLCKFLANNLCCLIRSQIELGIDAEFWVQLDDGRKDFLSYERGARAARGLAFATLPDASGRLANAYAYETDETVRRALVGALAARSQDADSPARREAGPPFQRPWSRPGG